MIKKVVKLNKTWECVLTTKQHDEIDRTSLDTTNQSL
jgi:hypothetical protein